MNQPIVKKVFELAMIFQTAAEAVGRRATVEMECYHVSQAVEENLCGTTACHAGWFGILRDGDGKRSTNYSDYALEMAQFLGFCDDFELEEWARIHPELWGNNHGDNMFSCERAFGVKEGGTVTLKRISDHWFKVGKRLELRKDFVKMEREYRKTMASVK